MGRLPASVPRITTSRRVVFRGCRYFVMFRPPSLLTPQIVPTAAILPQGSRGFYVRAYRALLPPHAPDMLTVRRQVIDGTGTCTLLDSQPCRLLRFPDPLSGTLKAVSAKVDAHLWVILAAHPKFAVYNGRIARCVKVVSSLDGGPSECGSHARMGRKRHFRQKGSRIVDEIPH